MGGGGVIREKEEKKPLCSLQAPTEDAYTHVRGYTIIAELHAVHMTGV